MARLKLSKNGLYLIESFEGFRAKSVSLHNGKYIIGFGHTVTARENMSITREQGEHLLLWDLHPIEEAVTSWVHAPINQNQFDALVSFAFNIGLDKFKDCEVLNLINEGKPIAAAMGLARWRKANINGREIIVDALIRRRAQEMALFLEPIGSRPAAPTPIVRPENDVEITISENVDEDVRAIKPVPQSANFTIKEKKPSEIKANVENLEQITAKASDNHGHNVNSKESSVPKNEEALVLQDGIQEGVNEEIITSPAKKNFENREENNVQAEEKVLQNDVANYFMLVAGLIAFIAGLYEIVRSGIFTGNFEQTIFNPNLIFVEIIAASGLLAVVIGVSAIIKDRYR